MPDLFRSLLTMTTIGSVLTLALFALKPALKNRLSKTAQYYLWLVVLIQLLIPLTITLPAPPVQPPATSNVMEEQPSVSADTGSLPIHTMREAIDQNVITTQEQIDRITEQASRLGEAAVRLPKHSPWSFLLSVAFVVWPLGIAVFLLWHLIAYWRFVFAMKRCRLPAREGETERLAVLSQQQNGGKRIELYRHTGLSTPILSGVFRPCLLLPDQDFTLEQLDDILLHELTHWKRRDVFVKWLFMMANAVHWFNPLVWLARREVNRACELSCDEAVIKALDDAKRRRYGDTLLSVVEHSAERCRHPVGIMSTTLCEDKRFLKTRILAIAHYKRATRLTAVISLFLSSPKPASDYKIKLRH